MTENKNPNIKEIEWMEGIWRNTTITVIDCPLSICMSLEDCAKCPALIEYCKRDKRLRCNILSDREKKMKPEKSIDVEYKKGW